MKVVALAGGVGGAKLAHGLAQALPPEDLTIVVNTGDDFEHLGLTICPDMDTVCYTLAGIANPQTGWGRVDETWQVFQNLEILGGPTWFNLGDRDLATYLERTRRLSAGQSLTEVTRSFCATWGIGPAVLPMSDQRVSTIVSTLDGELSFQKYFVALRCEPQVTGFHFDGIEQAVPAAGVLPAIEQADLVVICPSNPWVSVDPILGVPGLRDALNELSVVAVSPIIDGKTLKGPAAKMFAELGIVPSAQAVVEHYNDLLSGFVLDTLDSELVGKIRVKTLVTDTIMSSSVDRLRLAEEVLAFAQTL